MKPRSAKAKGRVFQQRVRDELLEAAPHLKPDDVRSTSMGAPGEDILLSPLARKMYPYSIECKNVEKLNIWKAIDQAREHSEYPPLVAFKKNGEVPYVALSLKEFLALHRNSGGCVCSGQSDGIKNKN